MRVVDLSSNICSLINLFLHGAWHESGKRPDVAPAVARASIWASQISIAMRNVISKSQTHKKVTSPQLIEPKALSSRIQQRITLLQKQNRTKKSKINYN